MSSPCSKQKRKRAAEQTSPKQKMSVSATLNKLLEDAVHVLFVEVCYETQKSIMNVDWNLSIIL